MYERTTDRGAADAPDGHSRLSAALSTPRLLVVADALRERGWRARAADLADVVADRSTDAAPEDVHVGLHHRDLPVLERAAVVDFDHRTGTVSPGPDAERFERFLDAVLESGAPDSRRT
ncbi:MAG: hypothetical protein ABEJ68_10865 [Halobacteriaceae archaeon]